jgi:hypothetical protein
MYIALFAGTAAAQSSVTLFNLFEYQSTLTQIGADATATTYKNECPTNSAGVSAIPADQSKPTTSEALPTVLTAAGSTPDSASATSAPATTPKARLARQASATASAADDETDYSFCEPYTLKQGPSTWEFHLTDPTPDAWTVDMNCRWQGAITAADLTCTVTQSGYVPDSSVLGVTTSVLAQNEAQSLDVFHAVAVMTASGAPSAAASALSSGSFSATASADAARSSGFAPARPLPTGAVIFVGGAAGVFAAAFGV